VSAAFDKAKAKLTGKGLEPLPGDQDEYERRKEKEKKKEERKADYERLDLANRTKFGMGRGGMTFS
jgi:hypothetical protein